MAELSRPPAEQPQLKPSRPPPPKSMNHCTTASRLKSEIERVGRKIDSALTLDSNGNVNGATLCYRQCLVDIQEIFNEYAGVIDSTESSNLTNMHNMIKERLIGLNDWPASSNEQHKASRPEMTMDDEEMLQVMWFLENESSQELNRSLHDEFDTVHSVDGVQYFSITPDGLVSALSSTGTMELLDCGKQQPDQPRPEQAHVAPSAIILLKDLILPLLRDNSVVLESGGNLLLPDPSRLGHSIALCLPKGSSETAKRTLIQLLNHYTRVVESSTDFSTPTLGDRIVSVSQGVASSVGWLSSKIPAISGKVSQKVKTWVKPVDSDKQVEISEEKRLQLQRVHYGTHVALQVTKTVVNAATSAAVAVGREIGSAVYAQIPDRYKQSAGSNRHLDKVFDIASGSFVAAGIVLDSLEQAAQALGRGLVEGTVDVVGHRYGQQAGQSAKDCLYSAGNVAYSMYMVRSLGLKRLTKRVAKHTGKTMIEKGAQDLKTDDPLKPNANK